MTKDHIQLKYESIIRETASIRAPYSFNHHKAKQKFPDHATDERALQLMDLELMLALTVRRYRFNLKKLSNPPEARRIQLAAAEILHMRAKELSKGYGTPCPENKRHAGKVYDKGTNVRQIKGIVEASLTLQNSTPATAQTWASFLMRFPYHFDMDLAKKHFPDYAHNVNLLNILDWEKNLDTQAEILQHKLDETPSYHTSNNKEVITNYRSSVILNHARNLFKHSRQTAGIPYWRDVYVEPAITPSHEENNRLPSPPPLPVSPNRELIQESVGSNWHLPATDFNTAYSSHNLDELTRLYDAEIQGNFSDYLNVSRTISPPPSPSHAIRVILQRSPSPSFAVASIQRTNHSFER